MAETTATPRVLARSEKIIFSMIQPEPLPGSYRHRDMKIDEIVDRALRETEMVANNGFDGIIVQNMNDMPIKQIAKPEAIAYMTRIAHEIRVRFPELVMGILMNWDGVDEVHGTPICPKAVDAAAWECVHEAFADGLFMSGKTPEESIQMVEAARKRVPNTPIFLGGGATGDNVRELMKYYDGVSVATWIKNGDMKNPIDPERARIFLEQAKG